MLFCWEDGRPPHPDTITRRFKKLATAAGLPEIDLHDVRRSYARGPISRGVFKCHGNRGYITCLGARTRA